MKSRAVALLLLKLIAVSVTAAAAQTPGPQDSGFDWAELRRSINLYLHLLQEGDDGKLHLPPTHSPESGTFKDASFDLALLKWGCFTLVEASKRLGIDDPLIPRWKLQSLRALTLKPASPGTYDIDLKKGEEVVLHSGATAPMIHDPCGQATTGGTSREEVRSAIGVTQNHAVLQVGGDVEDQVK